jgi:uncharacterized protein (TIGR03083 family)
VYGSVENLAATWASVDELCAGLPDGDWDLPTGCPGWTVKDHLSHLVDYESRALGRPAPDHDPGELPYLRNDMGRLNEVGVDARRNRPGVAVLGEFREVTAERLAQLGQLTEQDAGGPAMTPVGPGTVAELLTLRVMDSWSHEQDIRRAVGVPGHCDGPVVAEVVGYFTQFLPYVVGKRAAAPEGSKIVFRVGDLAPVAVEVTAGRGRIAHDAGNATATLAMPVATFAALVAGRGDAPGDARIRGDRELGQRVLDSMGILP